MLTVRVVPCLDVRDGRVVKGVQFQGLRDAGDPVERAAAYERDGGDEIVILDVSATTAKNGNNTKGSCGGGGRESVYAVKVHQTGKLNARITWADFDTVVYARRTDCANGVEAGCSNDVKKTFGNDLLTLDVVDNDLIWLFVDGISSGKGTFQLRLSLK